MKDWLASMQERTVLRRSYIGHSLANKLDISNIAVLMVSMVSHNLGAAIRKIETVLS